MSFFLDDPAQIAVTLGFCYVFLVVTIGRFISCDVLPHVHVNITVILSQFLDPVLAAIVNAHAVIQAELYLCETTTL